jgi:hypothetical protein
MGFIYGTLVFPKSDESHIACLLACESTIYFAFVTSIKRTIEVVFVIPTQQHIMGFLIGQRNDYGPFFITIITT